MTDFMQSILDDQRAYEKHGVGIDYEEEPAKQRRSYDVIYRDSTVVFEGYTYEATSFRKAVRKARKWARNNGKDTWSTYAVEVSGRPETRRYGPFKYSKKWGKS